MLDTHAWVWWLTTPAKLGKKAARAIQRAPRLGLPAICIWEIATKAEAKKLTFDRPYAAWLDEALAQDPRLQIVALSPRVSIESVRLSWAHRDLADRFIVASARVLEAPLVSADERIRESGLVSYVWD